MSNCMYQETIHYVAGASLLDLCRLSIESGQPFQIVDPVGHVEDKVFASLGVRNRIVSLDPRAQMQQLAAPAAELEALLPVLRGQLPLIVFANRVSDLRTALRIGREYKLKLILAGAAEGWEIAAELALAGVPVLVEPMDNIPSYDALGIRYENAALLAKAGVKVSLLEVDTHNSRRIRQQAGNAVSFGMTWDQALRAVTLTPAETFGVADRYGSLDAGKVANVVVWSGDPFEIATGAEHVFIRGHEIPLTSRQTQLLQRYRKLPPNF